MKKNLLIFCLFWVVACLCQASDSLTVKDVTGRAYMPEYLSSLTMLDDGDNYATFSKEYDKIVKYSLKTAHCLMWLMFLSTISMITR